MGSENGTVLIPRQLCGGGRGVGREGDGGSARFLITSVPGAKSVPKVARQLLSNDGMRLGRPLHAR